MLQSLAETPDPRLQAIMTSLVAHLHAFVREVHLTEDEWWRAIEFLTRTGHTCDASRQEFVLLSDTLGVSMLVDALCHRGEGRRDRVRPSLARSTARARRSCRSAPRSTRASRASRPS